MSGGGVTCAPHGDAAVKRMSTMPKIELDKKIPIQGTVKDESRSQHLKPFHRDRSRCISGWFAATKALNRAGFTIVYCQYWRQRTAEIWSY
jgi:hypothetical protein